MSGKWRESPRKRVNTVVYELVRKGLSAFSCLKQ